MTTGALFFVLSFRDRAVWAVADECGARLGLKKTAGIYFALNKFMNFFNLKLLTPPFLVRETMITEKKQRHVKQRHVWVPRINMLGFTLMEIMMVLALIAIMSAIAIPAIYTWLPGYRIKASARDIHGVAMKAKSEAVRRNVNAALTFNQAVGGVNFAYIVFLDGNQNCEYDAGELIVHQVRSLSDQVFFDTTKGADGDGLTFVKNDDGNPTIVFQPTGIPVANGGLTPNGTVFLVNSRGRELSVVINRAGSIRIN